MPVALNSGLFWPRRKFLRYPGTIRIEVLDPIPPGLDKEAFAARLKRDIETATARLVAEGEKELAAKGSLLDVLGLDDFAAGSRRHGVPGLALGLVGEELD